MGGAVDAAEVCDRRGLAIGRLVWVLRLEVASLRFRRPGNGSAMNCERKVQCGRDKELRTMKMFLRGDVGFSERARLNFRGHLRCRRFWRGGALAQV
jgi:hypothetical protein